MSDQPPRQERCRCNCGYKCGGPGVCQADIMTCLAEHFVKDCAHVWDGEEVELHVLGCNGSTKTCSRCGMLAEAHDLSVGP